jgi:hypothetical protein
MLAKRQILCGHTQVTRVHDLKITRELWASVALNVKTFEIRRNDRGFQQHDDLLLRALSEDGNSYSGEWAFTHVIYILDDEQYGMRPGFVIMSTRLITHGYANRWRNCPSIVNNILPVKS